MRKLLIIAIASIFMLQLSAQETWKSHPSDNLKIGVAGFSYRKYNIDQTLAYLKSMGVKYLSVKDFWLPLNSTKEEMDAFKAKCESYGVEGYILGPIYMRSKEDVDKTFAYAQRYGAKMFIGVPDYDLIDYVIQKVHDTGIRVAIHTHGPDGAAFPDIYKIMELVKDPNLGVGACLDLGHSFRSGNDVAKEIRKYHKWIYDIHIKDETAPEKAGQTWEIGRGQMDMVAIVKALKKVNYQGVVSIEMEKNSDSNPTASIAESLGYLRGVCDVIYK